MITIKKPEEIAALREGGRILASILERLAKKVAPGVSTQDLEDEARAEISRAGARPSFLHYKPYGAKRPFPAVLCVSVNDAIVHGIPNEAGTILQEGDIVSLDLGLVYKKMFTDMAVTVPVGKVDATGLRLIKTTEEALRAGIAAAEGGKTVGDIGEAIESFVRGSGFGIVRELSGHGVGYSVHEDPYVPNYGTKGQGAKLRPGMVIAIEPMLTEGGEAMKLDRDGYTYRTKDGKRAAHAECTVLITEGKPEVLTRL